MTTQITASTSEQYTATNAERKLAQVISYLFHPLFIPILVVWLMLYQHPIHYLLTDGPIRLRLMAMTFINTLFLPGFVVFLLWRLKFIPNMYLESRKDRIIPLNVVLIFYFWAFYVGRNLDAIPVAMQQWLLGVFLGSCAAMFCNIFFKISLHTIAVGGAVFFFAQRMYHDPYWPAWWIIPVVLIAGLVGTARLLRNAHQQGELYAGYLVGAICQLAAMLVIH
ncbi:MAG TPA: hypothetical protein VLC98_09865 [Phnomibacter sp.]|nr:hypothetical protein [Phnomibacter sp.]